MVGTAVVLLRSTPELARRRDEYRFGDVATLEVGDECHEGLAHLAHSFVVRTALVGVRVEAAGHRVHHAHPGLGPDE